MPWHFYVVIFLAGMLLANAVPHFVQGISGVPFPTPFAKPPGQGESSPRVNVVWGLANFAGGFVLLHFFWPVDWRAWAVVGAGAAVLSVLMAGHFGKVRAGKHS